MEESIGKRYLHPLAGVQLLLTVLIFAVLCYSTGSFGVAKLVLAILLGAISILCTFSLHRISDRGSRYAYKGLIVFLTVVFLLALCVPNIDFDTWQVYDMSRYVFSDFGYMQMIRQHIANTHYEMAFPPLLPVLLALFNGVVDLGVMSNVVLVYVFALLTVVTLARLGQQLEINRVFAFTTAAAVCNNYYIQGVRGGNTQILGWLLLALLAKLSCGKRLTPKVLCQCAIVAGLGLMNRFDFLAVGAVTLLVLPLISWLQEKDRLKRFAVKVVQVWALFGLVISPWFIYSRLRFGSWFITDNGRRLLNIVDTRPSTYFPAEVPAQTISDDFGAWVIAFLQRTFATVGGLFKAGVAATCLAPICVGCILLLAAGWRNIRSPKVSEPGFSMSRLSSFIQDKGGVIYFILCILGQECTIFLTGYEESRYHLAFLITLQVLIGRFALQLRQKCEVGIHNEPLIRGIKYLMVLNLLLVAVLPWRSFTQHFRQDTYGFATQLALDGTDQELAEYLHDNDCTCLVLSRTLQATNSPRFAALSNLTTILTPSNLDTGNVEYFVRDFNVDFLYADDEETVRIFEDAQGLQETPFAGVYKVGEK